MIYILVALAHELPRDFTSRDDVEVVYTGVGKINAAMIATEVAALRDCDMIINYGTAGALAQHLVAKLSVVREVCQRDMDARPMAALGVTPFEATGHEGALAVAHEGAVLGTGDQFVMSAPELQSDLVDMEGYAIAKAAMRADKPIAIVKYGSDFADENASTDWQENCANGAKLFAEWFERHY